MGFARPSFQDAVTSITGSAMRSVPDITMDGSYGTSEASPLLAGVLALATQENRGNVAPINPVLYGGLGPHASRAGIEDVIGGNDSFTLPDNTVVPGFTTVKGFDVASGWGTVNAPAFVHSLLAATRADHEERAARRQALRQLLGLEHDVTLSRTGIPRGGTAELAATGFLPPHLVQLSVDGRVVASVRATGAGTVSYSIDPARLHLRTGPHLIRLAGMLLTATVRFCSS